MSNLSIGNIVSVGLSLLFWLYYWGVSDRSSRSLISTYTYVETLSWLAFIISALLTIFWDNHQQTAFSFLGPLMISPIFLVGGRAPSMRRMIVLPIAVLLMLIGFWKADSYVRQRDLYYGDLVSWALTPNQFVVDSDAPSSPGSVLRRGRFVILQSDKDSPDVLHYKGNHRFPLPASKNDETTYKMLLLWFAKLSALRRPKGVSGCSSVP
jgi:hypothetical protein